MFVQNPYNPVSKYPYLSQSSISLHVQICILCEDSGEDEVFQIYLSIRYKNKEYVSRFWQYLDDKTFTKIY